jgi:MazG family protein
MKNLTDIADKLLSPEGCAWDREQTFFTLQPYLLEEMHELIEAIDLQQGDKIQEELGDVLYAVVFVAKLAEKKGWFTFESAVKGVCEKLIRRHPHVFGDLKTDSTEEILENWEKIKKQEGRKNPLEGIPPSLPALARAQKVVRKLKRVKKSKEDPLLSEAEIGQRLWALVEEAEKAGVDAESALRRASAAHESAAQEKS